MSPVKHLQKIFLRWRALKDVRPPIFIVGCGHSGTTMLRNALGAHSRLHAIPRETYFAYAKPVAMWRNMLGFRREAFAAGFDRWVEKTPKHIHRIPTLLDLHPAARVVVIVRDGRDVAVSLAKRSGDLMAGAERWVNDNRAALRYENHPRVSWVRYEDIVVDFESTMTRLMGELEESYEPVMRQLRRTRPESDLHLEKPPDEKGENHVRYRQWQLSQPLFDGRGRQKELAPAEVAEVENIQRELLIHFDYPVSNPDMTGQIPT